jgi:hypothetical protein
MSMSSTTYTGSTSESTPPISEALDRLSLEQALRDVEVANARVIDLTARLTESHAELSELRRQLRAAPAASPAATAPGSLRRLIAPPVKAVARRILPPGVRARLRSALR